MRTGGTLGGTLFSFPASSFLRESTWQHVVSLAAARVLHPGAVAAPAFNPNFPRELGLADYGREAHISGSSVNRVYGGS